MKTLFRVNDNKRLGAGTLIVAIAAILLVSSTIAIGHDVEAKSKKTKITVYVKNIFKTKSGENQKLKVCLKIDDPGCLYGFSKTVTLKNDGKHGIQKVATFKVKLSNNPKSDFTINDVDACGKLKHAIEFACGREVKTGKNSYKSTIDYRELYENNFICTDPSDGSTTTCSNLDRINALDD